MCGLYHMSDTGKFFKLSKTTHVKCDYNRWHPVSPQWMIALIFFLWKQMRWGIIMRCRAQMYSFVIKEIICQHLLKTVEQTFITMRFHIKGETLNSVLTTSVDF